MASHRVWAKILELVLWHSTTMNSLGESGIVVRKLSYGCAAGYWTLGLRHDEMRLLGRINIFAALPAQIRFANAYGD
jgi:hypothetical protein